MDEKLSEFREWLVAEADNQFATDGYASYMEILEEFDGRFGA